jgi:large subunit ribosomal protein L9
MKIILLETITGLGKIGDEVTVKPGYARNFLLPKNKALTATKANMTIFEAKKAELEKTSKEAKKVAETIATSIEKVQAVMVERQASEVGHLYGSVKARDIQEALKTNGVEIERSQVQISEPIKELGEFNVKIALHSDVMSDLQVQVNRLTA